MKSFRVRKLGDDKTKVQAVFPRMGWGKHLNFNVRLRSRSYNFITSVLILAENYSGHLTGQILGVQTLIKYRTTCNIKEPTNRDSTLFPGHPDLSNHTKAILVPILFGQWLMHIYR